MLTIQEFCDKHGACYSGRKWAINNCNTMQEAWDKCDNPSWLIWIATRESVLDVGSLRLFAAWCCRQIQHLMKDPRSIAAVAAVEQFANGLSTANQLEEARKSAYAAYAAAADAYAAAARAADAAYAAAADAAARAADAAAYAARAVVYAAATDAYAAAARAADAAYAAAYATNKEAKIKQMNYLRQNCKPNFE